jgi:putative ABC transport system permease protein
MFRNYVQTILRGFKKNRVYATLNVIGLSVGFACVLYISLYIDHETTYDQFLPENDQVFRLSDRSYALTSPVQMEYLVENLTDIEYSTFLLNRGNFIIGINSDKFIEKKVFYASDNFFKIFPHKVLSGSYQNFDSIPNAVVITQHLASKLFKEEEALNKSMVVYQGGEERLYKVIAVLEDLPTNTHMSFNMIAHMPKATLAYERDNWGYTIYHGYVKSKSALSTLDFQSRVDRVFAKRAIDNNWFDGINTVDELLASKRMKTPLVLRADDIYLASNLNFDLQAGGNSQYLWVFGGTALFVLILAAINFINLATAQSVKRAKEVGIRKTLGSTRGKLVFQLMSESVILCLIAAVMALGLVELSIVFMRNFASLSFSFGLLDNPLFLGLLFVVAILTALLSGIYPAFYLTSFNPAKVLKGKLVSKKGTGSFRNVLVVFQFTISLGLGIFMFFIQDQLHYGLQKNVGFEKENLVTLDNSLGQLGEKASSFKNEILSSTKFTNAGYFTSDLFGMTTTFISPIENPDLIEPFRVYYQWTDADYLPTLDVEFVAGRNFDENIKSDTSVMIINETTARVLGFKDPIGKYVNFGGSPGQFKIVGVIKDIHHQSFDKQVPPTLFVHFEDISHAMTIRIAKGDVIGSITQLENTWAKYSDKPLDYHFVDQGFEKLFDKEQQLGKIIRAFTGLAFFVACLGLLGLAGYTAEQKTKEIGIRKSLGASVEQIVRMFSSNFAKLILIAMILASPLAYFTTNFWLNSFAYRIEMQLWPFILVGFTGLFIVLTTVSYHMICAAVANPVHALKDE